MPSLLPPLLALGLVWLTYRILAGGYRIKAGQTVTNMSGNAFVLAAVSVLAAMLVFGWITGLIVVIGIAIHEAGHVFAYRAMGHTDARFRLIPLLGGVAISSKLPRDQLSDFFVSYMGPGIMICIVVLALTLAEYFLATDRMLSILMMQIAIFTGAINFFNLLPLWPLDGGRILRTLTYRWSPMASRYLTLVMSIGLAVWAFFAQAPLIFLVAILGFSSARRIAVINRAQAAMTGQQSVVASIAYLCALAVHGLAGWPLIERVVFRN